MSMILMIVRQNVEALSILYSSYSMEEGAANRPSKFISALNFEL